MVELRSLNDGVEEVDINLLRPHPKNPNRGDVVALRESIEVGGWWGYIIAQRSTGYILAGEHRWLAMRASGARTIPVAWVEVDDQHAERILLADNQIARRGQYDDKALLDLLESVASLEGTGFIEDDFLALQSQFGSDDENQEETVVEGDGFHEQDRPSPNRPEKFKTYDDDQQEDYCCPKCGFEWSGNTR